MKDGARCTTPWKMTSFRAMTTRLTALARGLFLAGASLAILVTACVSENDLTPDQRAYVLDRELMCPVCDGQTIDQSHAQIAQDMKLIVREQISQGRSNQEIKDYFVARYGQSVLAAPEASGFNIIIWVMPVVIGGGGALAVLFVLRNMRRKPTGSATTEPLAGRELAQYLEKVDQDLGLDSSRLSSRPHENRPESR